MGERIGYKRVSTRDQNADRQLEGLVLTKTFVDYASGKDTNRPKLQEMIGYIREGDEVFVHSLDRLGRNLSDLKKIISIAIDKGCKISFAKEGLNFERGIEAESMSTFLLHIMGAFAEFERSLIRERQIEGIAIAKERGRYRGGQPKLAENQVIEMMDRLNQGISKARVARYFKITRQTIYKYLREQKK